MFKDTKGAWKTKALFVELLGVDERERLNPMYSLREEDFEKYGNTYKSLYKLFMESVDEYDFATTHLGGLTHWNKLKSSTWFSRGYRMHRGSDQWIEDMRARDESKAKKAVMLAVSEGDTVAAKKLWDMSKKTAETKRGRFVKEEAKREAASKVKDSDILSDAALRLNVVPIRD